MAKRECKMTVRELTKIAEATEEWATSYDGRKALEEAQRRVKETTDFLSAERVVDSQVLQMPLSL